MKINPIKNDPTTMKDEIVLSIITALAFAVGIALIVLKPNFWFIGADDSVVFGVLIMIASIVYVPSIIYRFMTNHHPKKIINFFKKVLTY
jgi:hypothetical protein